MHAIPTYNSAALPQPWAENSNVGEATTPNKGYRVDERNHHQQEEEQSTNQHIPSSTQTNNHDCSDTYHHHVNHNCSTPSTTTSSHYQDDPTCVKRHCTESRWNTLRQAYPQTQGMMMTMAIHDPSTHLQSSAAFARKRVYHHENDCPSTSGEGIVKKSRHNMMVEASSDETDISMQCESPPTCISTQEAEEVWNFIGIG